MDQQRQKPTYRSEVDHLFEYSGKKCIPPENILSRTQPSKLLDDTRSRRNYIHYIRKMEKSQSSQECYRALQFESEDEEDGSDDHTAPLVMMDITNMTSGSSMIQASSQEWHKPNLQPVSKSLLPLLKTCSGIQRLPYLRNMQSENNTSQTHAHSNQENKSLARTKRSVIKAAFEGLQINSLILKSNVDCFKSSNSQQALNAASQTQNELKTKNMQWQSENNTSQTNAHSNQENKSLARTKRSLIKAAFEGNYSKSSQINSLILKSTVDSFNSSNSQQVLNSVSKTMSELKDNMQWHDKGSSKKVTFAEEPVRKGLRRKSASTLCIRTPTHKNIGRNSKVKSTSKLPISSRRLQFIDRPVQETHSTCAKQTVSKPTETGASLNGILPQIIVSSPCKVQVIQNQDDERNDYSTCHVKCDAAVNTKISFVCGSSPDEQLVAKIENLNKEQEEITIKANLLLEQTRERRRQMKELGIMTRFATSISPLKRLQKLLHDKDHFVEERDSPILRILDNSSMNRNTFPYEASLNSDINCADDSSNAVDLMDPNLSVQECDMSYGIASDSFWNDLKRDNRFLQTPGRATAHKFYQEMPTQTDEEMLSDENEPKSISPVAELDGECERPSLAPMTPHSHQQVSQLKLSLKKQLELLYD